MDDWYIHTVSSLSKSVKIKIDGKCKQPLQAHIQTKRSGDKINQSNYRNCWTNIDAGQNNSSHDLHCSFHPAPHPPQIQGYFHHVVSPFHTCKQFRTVLNSPLHSCISNEIIWDFGIRPASNSSADNKGEMDGYKTRAIISLCTVFLFFFKLLVYSLGLSGVLMKCCDVKVFPSGYLGWAGSLESIYVQNKCITSWKEEIARSV